MLPKVNQSPFGWLGQLGQHDIAHLGEYKGSDALTKKVVERKGAVDSDSLKAYGAVMGGMSGAAVCAAFVVTAPLAVGCAVLGSIIGGALASLIPIASGSTIDDVVVDTWNANAKPYLDTGPNGIMAIKAYLIMRDKFIFDTGAPAGMVDAFLTSQGLPGAPVRQRWAPIPKRSLAFEAFVVNKLPDGFGPECVAAKKLLNGITCRDYLLLRDMRAPPISAASDPIDWGLVAWDQFLTSAHKTTMMIKQKCRILLPDGSDIPITCPTERPSEVAKALIAKLAQTEYKALPPPAVSSGSSGSSGSLGGTVVKAGIGAAVLWGLFKVFVK